MKRDSKTKGRIVGVTGMEGTLVWTLTAHMMAAATASFKVGSQQAQASIKN